MRSWCSSKGSILVSNTKASRHGARSTRGFTLVEVLVAMAILAIGVSALVTASGASAFRSGQLSDREFGRWVAANHLNTLQAQPGWPDLGTANIEVEMQTFNKETEANKIEVNEKTEKEGKLVEKEHREKGKVSMNVYWQYVVTNLVVFSVRRHIWFC